MTTGTTASIDTIASLRAFSTSISAPYTFDVQDYNTINDQGGGSFIYNAADTSSGALFNGTISGTSLTINSVTNGALVKGQFLGGTGIPSGVQIISGSGTSWTISQSLGSLTETMTSDNGGTIIVDAAGHRWYRQFVVITPQMYGAVGSTGTPSVDETAQVQAALTFCKGGGGNLLFNRFFLVTKSLDGTGSSIRCPYEITGTGLTNSGVYGTLTEAYPILDLSGWGRVTGSGFAIITHGASLDTAAVLLSPGSLVIGNAYFSLCQFSGKNGAGIAIQDVDLSMLDQCQCYCTGTGNAVSVGHGLPAGVNSKYVTNTSGAATTGSSISGTTLSIGAVSGAVAIGQCVTGTGVASGTFITAGSGLTWTVNNSQTVPPTAINMGQANSSNYFIKGGTQTGQGGAPIALLGAYAFTLENNYAAPTGSGYSSIVDISDLSGTYQRMSLNVTSMRTENQSTATAINVFNLIGTNGEFTIGGGFVSGVFTLGNGASGGLFGSSNAFGNINNLVFAGYNGCNYTFSSPSSPFNQLLFAQACRFFYARGGTADSGAVANFSQSWNNEFYGNISSTNFLASGFASTPGVRCSPYDLSAVLASNNERLFLTPSTSSTAMRKWLTDKTFYSANISYTGGSGAATLLTWPIKIGNLTFIDGSGAVFPMPSYRSKFKMLTNTLGTGGTTFSLQLVQGTNSVTIAASSIASGAFVVDVESQLINGQFSGNLVAFLTIRSVPSAGGSVTEKTSHFDLAASGFTVAGGDITANLIVTSDTSTPVLRLEGTATS